VIDDQASDENRLEDMLQKPYQYAVVIKEKIQDLLTEFARKTFDDGLATNDILVEPIWPFPPHIEVPEDLRGIAKSLYSAESAKGNGLELKLTHDLANLDNVLFWHRNAQRDPGFCLNGFINHYPDFIVHTQKGNWLMLETKGGDRNNSDSRRKLHLGKAWESRAGITFKYLMVFESEPIDAAYGYNAAIEKIARL
jgi:type III restriction enzyme